MKTLLCLDIGNTHMFGGLFVNDVICLRFRYPTQHPVTSDQIGLFLKAVLRENTIDPSTIEAISISSVVPSLNYSIRSACIKYLKITPFQLKPGVKTGLQLHIKNPIELGADRIANAVGALHRFPEENLIVVDFGTATTLCAISAKTVYLGGAIMPGFKVSATALHQNTANLIPVTIIKPAQALGKCTTDHIQSGLYYGQLGAVKELIHHLSNECFPTTPPRVISTGGYAYLFKEEAVFANNLPDLALEGLRLILMKNR